MNSTTGPKTPTSAQSSSILVLEDIEAHYRIGRTKAIELVAGDGFVKTVVPGMHRYPAAAIAAYDLAAALAGTAVDPANKPAPGPIVVTPPAPGRPGPKAGSGKKAR